MLILPSDLDKVQLSAANSDEARLSFRSPTRRFHIFRCFRQSVIATIDRSCFFVIASRPRSVAGNNRICSCRSGARQSKFMICVSLARVTWPKRASSAWSVTSPSRINWSSRMASAMRRDTRGTRPGVSSGPPCSSTNLRPSIRSLDHDNWCKVLLGSY